MLLIYQFKERGVISRMETHNQRVGKTAIRKYVMAMDFDPYGSISTDKCLVGPVPPERYAEMSVMAACVYHQPKDKAVQEARRMARAVEFANGRLDGLPPLRSSLRPVSWILNEISSSIES
jgi:hypothetical protein